MAKITKEEIVEDIQRDFAYDIIGDMNPFKKAYKSRKMFPLPVSDIAGDVVKLAPYQVIPEAMKKKEGDFVEVPVKLARTKKTRIY